MRIEILYFDGCPGYERLIPRLEAALARSGIRDPVELVQVESLQDAERQRFLGSPTLRIDGVDVDPVAHRRTDYGLKCRLYRTEQGHQPLPTDDVILAAIHTAALAPQRTVKPSITPPTPPTRPSDDLGPARPRAWEDPGRELR